MPGGINFPEFIFAEFFSLVVTKHYFSELIPHFIVSSQRNKLLQTVIIQLFNFLQGGKLLQRLLIK